MMYFPNSPMKYETIINQNGKSLFNISFYSKKNVFDMILNPKRLSLKAK